MSDVFYPLYDTRNPAYEEMRRKVVRKIDWNTIPGLSLLYLAAFIDRTNIGNAKVAGLDKDLHLKGNQFNTTLTAFYITYILVELPSNYLLRYFGAKVWLPLLVGCWGVVTVFSAFVKNFESLIIIRLLLGFFEGGIYPGMIFYLSTLYKREELQWRVGLFFTSAALSGAFGGLLAYGIQRMDGVGGKASWSWIFILEGLATILVSIFAWFYLCSSVGSASFLNEKERDFAVNRLRIEGVAECEPASLEKMSLDAKNCVTDTSQVTDSITITNTSQTVEAERFEWAEVRRGFMDPQVWLIGLAAITATVPILSLGFFLPTLVKALGYSGAKAQLLSAYPYIPASALVVLVAFLADKLRMRGPIALILLPMSIAGYALLITVESIRIRYAAIYLLAMGLWPTMPCLFCTLSNNTSGTVKRATVTALAVMISNLAGLAAPQIYTPDQSPFYIKGHTIGLVFSCAAWIFTAANVIYCRRENACRRAGKRDYMLERYGIKFRAGETQAPIGDRDPSFRFTL